MRIVGGALRGRRIEAPAAVTRPTSARVREAIASALHSRGVIEGAQVLDLFAGTGALALEMLSRGAARAEVVDCDGAALRAIKRSINTLDLRAQTVVRRSDVFRDPARAVGTGPYDLIFLDPPYARVGELPDVFPALQRCANGALVVLETGRDAESFDAFLFPGRRYGYGDTHVTIAELRAPSP